MLIKLGLVQMHCLKGKIRTNLATTKKYIREAVLKNIDFICFPEMSITGYINATNFPEVLLNLDSPEVNQFIEMTKNNDITAIVGISEKNSNDKPFITQIIAHRGELLGYYRKTNVAKDEKGLFSSGSEINTFSHPKLKFGVSVCADIDEKEIFEEYAKQGAKVIFESAAPGLYGSQETRNWQSGFDWWKNECQTKLGAYANAHKIYIAVATQSGRTIDEDFPGGGYVFNPEGKTIYSTSDWKEGILYADIDVY